VIIVIIHLSGGFEYLKIVALLVCLYNVNVVGSEKGAAALMCYPVVSIEYSVLLCFIVIIVLLFSIFYLYCLSVCLFVSCCLI